MNVGIITVQKAPENFGACLQCYALWRFIKSQGHNCEVIDLVRPWSPDYIESKMFKEKHPKTKTPFYKKLVYTLMGKNKPSKKNIPVENDNFRAFNGLMSYSKTFYSVDSLYKNPPAYDAYISGSDQIWNPLMPFINEPYFLTFVPKGKKKISYASSFAVKEIPEGMWPSHLEWLDDYDAISVRESSGVDIVNKVFGRDATLVVDPTLLLTKKEWEDLLVKPSIKEKYLLVYTLQYNQQIVDQAINLSWSQGLVVYVVISSTTGAMPESRDGVRFINTAGPKEWIGYIHEAEYVITDSFHGSVFSFILSKRLLTVCTNKKVSERLATLFDGFSLSNNYIDIQQFESLKDLKQSYYPIEAVQKTINELRNKSVSYLLEALK